MCGGHELAFGFARAVCVWVGNNGGYSAELERNTPGHICARRSWFGPAVAVRGGLRLQGCFGLRDKQVPWWPDVISIFAKTPARARALPVVVAQGRT